MANINNALNAREGEIVRERDKYRFRLKDTWMLHILINR